MLEQLQLTRPFRNSCPLPLRRGLQQGESFANTRVVYGGLVFASVLSLTSRDLTRNPQWDVGLDDGAHPKGRWREIRCIPRASCEKEDTGPDSGVLTWPVVGTKNRSCEELFATPGGLFTAEFVEAGWAHRGEGG